jgi:hypothetical protein
MGLGRVNRAVPRAIVTSTNQLKARIIAGKVKVPTSL